MPNEDTTTNGRALLQHAREVYYGGQAADVTLDVFIQDQVTPPFQYYLMNEQKTDILLVSGTSVGDTVIYVDPGHGFTAAGEYVTINEGSLYTQAEVLGVASDDITIATPLSNVYSTDANVIRGEVDMNVSGSVSAYLFELPMWGEVPVDIQTVRVTMQHTTAGDDSKFGNLPELTTGLFFRKTNSFTQNLGNYKSNQEFFEFGADVEYTDKAGGGNHGTNVTLDLKKIYGIVIRLDPRINDVFSASVRDDLDTLLGLRVSVMGQFTQGE